jgi:hypothetical protein
MDTDTYVHDFERLSTFVVYLAGSFADGVNSKGF